MFDWLLVMLIGLGLDIIGVLLLAEPILRIDLRNKSHLEKLTREAIEEYKRVKDQKPGLPESEIPTWPVVAKIEAMLYQLHLAILNEKIVQKRKAIIALIMISFGFILQILGNILQANTLQKLP